MAIRFGYNNQVRVRRMKSYNNQGVWGVKHYSKQGRKEQRVTVNKEERKEQRVTLNKEVWEEQKGYSK